MSTRARAAHFTGAAGALLGGTGAGSGATSWVGATWGGSGGGAAARSLCHSRCPLTHHRTHTVAYPAGRAPHSVRCRGSSVGGGVTTAAEEAASTAEAVEREGKGVSCKAWAADAAAAAGWGLAAAVPHAGAVLTSSRDVLGTVVLVRRDMRASFLGLV